MLKFVYKKNKKKIKSITLYAVAYSHEFVNKILNIVSIFPKTDCSRIIRNILYGANLRLKLSHRLEFSKSCFFLCLHGVTLSFGLWWSSFWITFGCPYFYCFSLCIYSIGSIIFKGFLWRSWGEMRWRFTSIRYSPSSIYFHCWTQF